MRAVVALFLGLGIIWTAQLSTPTLVQACSCLPEGPGDIGTVANFPNAVVFIGTVTAMDPAGPGQEFGHRFGEMRIERLFKGSVPAVVRVKGGGGGDCTMQLSVAQRMITVASYADGVLTPALCNPYGDPNTAEGEAIIADAVAAYGPGMVPDQPPASSPPTAAPQPAATLALPLVLGATLAVAVLLFGAVALIARRRREELTE